MEEGRACPERFGYSTPPSAAPSLLHTATTAMAGSNGGSLAQEAVLEQAAGVALAADKVDGSPTATDDSGGGGSAKVDKPGVPDTPSGLQREASGPSPHYDPSRNIVLRYEFLDSRAIKVWLLGGHWRGRCAPRHCLRRQVRAGGHHAAARACSLTAAWLKLLRRLLVHLQAIILVVWAVVAVDLVLLILAIYVSASLVRVCCWFVC